MILSKLAGPMPLIFTALVFEILPVKLARSKSGKKGKTLFTARINF